MAMLIALSAIAFAGCNDKVSDEIQKAQNNTEQTGSQAALYRGVSAAEYSNSDVDMRRLIDLVDGAANALLAMQQNGANRGFEADIIFSTKEEGIFANSVVISRPNREEQADTEPSEKESETCKVCGLKDGLDCYKKIKKTLCKFPRESLNALFHFVPHLLTLTLKHTRPSTSTQTIAELKASMKF